MKQFLKLNIKKVKILVAFLIVASTTHAQEFFTITGKVVDKQEAIPGANVFVKGTSKGTSTNFNGNFKLTLEKGTYTLLVSFVSEPKEVQINLNQNIDLTIDLSDNYTKLDEVLVSAVRVNATAPVTHSNVSKKDLAQRNLGQDIPILVNYLPSVVTTSDAGAGIGYTGIRVRGSDASRVNVTINGIPYNDAESQGTFWVNMPDFTSSVENLQLQRGVGTSTNGSGAFGASLNLLTDAIAYKPFGEINSAIGSYNTYKNTVKFSTGLINEHVEISGRFSKIDSDGYIDNAWSDLKSYFLQAAYINEHTLIKALTFGGHEKTYQAWYGVTKEEMETLGRTYNPYSYDNEIDNYKQNHFQFHWNEKINSNWSSNIGLNYTKGEGYFEQYKEDEDFDFYNLTPINIGNETIQTTDIIRRRWLDNNFYVVNANAIYTNEKLELIFGGSFSNYSGKHFGEIIWAEYASNSSIRDRYYESEAKKTDFNIFGKMTYDINKAWTLFTDIQGRFVGYNTHGLTSDKALIAIDKNFSFFNPKAGVTFKANDVNSFYASYAKAHREPNRNDFENGVEKPEKLDDFELGWRYKNGNTQINTNIYYMHYKDQLVLTGAVDDVGSFIRATSGKSYRLGLEIDAVLKPTSKLFFQPNIALSSNKNVDFYATINETLVNLGNTNLSFSPEVVFGNTISYLPAKNLQLALLTKYVGKQHMGNLEEAVSTNDVLESYFVNDLNITYTLKPVKVFESITLNALINNIFNEKYISNGYYGTYDWDGITYDYAGYYPQATTNFLIGISLKF